MMPWPIGVFAGADARCVNTLAGECVTASQTPPPTDGGGHVFGRLDAPQRDAAQHALQ